MIRRWNVLIHGDRRRHEGWSRILWIDVRDLLERIGRSLRGGDQ